MSDSDGNVSTKRIIALVFLASFLILLSSDVQIPTASLFSAEAGASLLQVGLIASVGSVVRLVFRMPIGLLSDRYGRRPLILFSAICTTSSLFLLYASASPLQIMGSMAVNALGTTITFTIGMTMAAEVYPKRAETGISVFAFASSLASFLAPILCSVLLVRMPIRVTYLVGGLIGITGIVSSVLLPKKRGVRSSFDISKSLGSIFRNKAVQLVSFLQIPFAISWTTIFTYFPLQASTEMGLLSSEIALLLSMFSLGMMVIRIPLPRLFGRVSETKLITLAFLDYALVMFTIPLVKESAVLAILIGAAGMAHGIMFPAMTLHISSNAERMDLGLANAVYGGSGDAVGIVAPIALSAVITLWGYIMFYYVVFSLNLIALTLMILIIVRSARQQKGVTQ
ncbi:MAG: MFS transporter [archaeon]